MHCVEEIKNGIYWMGCNDFRTELFERIFPIPEGVTYNSYFIDDEKTCVVDAMDKSCRDDQECELDELADKLVESIKEYPDPKTLI